MLSHNVHHRAPLNNNTDFARLDCNVCVCINPHPSAMLAVLSPRMATRAVCPDVTFIYVSQTTKLARAITQSDPLRAQRRAHTTRLPKHDCHENRRTEQSTRHPCRAFRSRRSDDNMGNAVTNPGRTIEKKIFGVENRNDSIFVNHNKSCEAARAMVPWAAKGLTPPGRAGVSFMVPPAQKGMEQKLHQHLDARCPPQR